MSGGLWYGNDTSLAHDIFSWDISPTYGEKGFAQSKQAREINPLRDKIISELIWDVFCLLNSFDCQQCGDTTGSYDRDKAVFKKKWLNLDEERIRQIIDEEMERTKVELYEAFNCGNEEEK